MKELIAVTFGKKIKLSPPHSLKNFTGDLSEEKPNKRTGMWDDVRLIRMFNQEGRPSFFSFAVERRRQGQAVGRSSILTLLLKSQPPLAYSLVSQLGLGC